MSAQPWWQGLVVGAVLMPLWFMFTVRPRVLITDEHVVLRNPIWTVRVPLAEVADAEPGYFGVTVRRHQERPVTAWALSRLEW